MQKPHYRTVDATDARINLGDYIDAAYYRHQVTGITKNRSPEPRAVILSYEQYRNLLTAAGPAHPEQATEEQS